MAYLVIDLQILGPKNMKPWLHLHFDLALAQDAAGEEHPSRHAEQPPTAVPLVQLTQRLHKGCCEHSRAGRACSHGNWETGLNSGQI